MEVKNRFRGDVRITPLEYAKFLGDEGMVALLEKYKKLWSFENQSKGTAGPSNLYKQRSKNSDFLSNISFGGNFSVASSEDPLSPFRQKKKSPESDSRYADFSLKLLCRSISENKAQLLQVMKTSDASKIIGEDYFDGEKIGECVLNLGYVQLISIIDSIASADRHALVSLY